MGTRGQARGGKAGGVVRGHTRPGQGGQRRGGGRDIVSILQGAALPLFKDFEGGANIIYLYYLHCFSDLQRHQVVVGGGPSVRPNGGPCIPTALCNNVQHHTAPYSTVEHRTAPYRDAQNRTAPHDTTHPPPTIPHHTIPPTHHPQYHTTRYHPPTTHHTTPHDTTHPPPSPSLPPSPGAPPGGYCVGHQHYPRTKKERKTGNECDGMCGATSALLPSGAPVVLR